MSISERVGRRRAAVLCRSGGGRCHQPGLPTAWHADKACTPVLANTQPHLMVSFLVAYSSSVRYFCSGFTTRVSSSSAGYSAHHLTSSCRGREWEAC